MLEVLIEVVKGAVSGAIASAIGYAKQEKPDKWDFNKASKTIFLGMITNSIVRGTKMPIPELSVKISEWLATEGIAFIPAIIVEGMILTGIVMVVDQMVKVLVRRTDVMTAWNKLKAYLSKYWY